MTDRRDEADAQRKKGDQPAAAARPRRRSLIDRLLRRRKQPQPSSIYPLR